MPEPSSRRLDRYLSGEASPEEQRALAQEALDDPDLFELLTTAALVSQASRRDSIRPVSVPPTPWSSRWTFGIAALAAAAVLFLTIGSQWWRTPEPQPRQAAEAGASAVAAPTPLREPVTTVATALPRPVWLLASSAAASDPSRPQAFRAPATQSRLPRQQGTIDIVDDGVATVDLGSLDGLSPGSVLSVIDETVGSPLRRLVVTAVFRERARAATPDGALAAGEHVRVEDAEYLLALADQIGARFETGDAATARTLAAKALPLTRRPGLRADARRAALARLGALAHASGDLDAADQQLSRAAEALDTRPVASSQERGEILNELGVVAAERGDLGRAETSLVRAQKSLPGKNVLAAQVTNNRGGVAALRGDRPAAESLYQSALDLVVGSAAGESARAAIEQNLAAIRGQK